MNDVKQERVIKWCNTCSRTFNCVWPKIPLCDIWGPDLYATEAIANGAEVVPITDLITEETNDEGMLHSRD